MVANWAGSARTKSWFVRSMTLNCGSPAAADSSAAASAKSSCSGGSTSAAAR